VSDARGGCGGRGRAWLVVAGLLAGCAPTAGEPRLARVRLAPDLEMRFQYPAGWTYERDGDMLVFKARKGPDAAVPTLFVQTRRADGGQDLSREVTKILAQHRQEAQSQVEAERWEEVMGSPAFRFLARFSMNGVPYRMAQEIVSRAGRFIYFSAVAPADGFRLGAAAFDEVLATLDFGPPEGGGVAPDRRDGASFSLVREALAAAYYGAVILAGVVMVLVLVRRRRRADLDLEVRARHLGDVGLLHVEVGLHNTGRKKVTLRRRRDGDADGQLARRGGVALGLEVRPVRGSVARSVTWRELTDGPPAVDLLVEGTAGDEGNGGEDLRGLLPGQRRTFSAVVPLTGPGAALVKVHALARKSGEVWERVVAVPLENHG